MSESTPGKQEAEQLKNAVGDQETTPSTLRHALQQLGDDQGADTDQLTDKAKAVKDKYGDNWIGVKQKYNEVVKQKTAGKYGLSQGQTEYDKVVEAWNDFNNLYHDSISTEKFYITVIPSIFSILSDLSPQTKYVYHGTNRNNNGFGGWTWYKDHQGELNNKESGTPEDCPDSLPPDGNKGTHVAVHAWIWHYFDLVIPIKISLSIIFIYSLDS